MKYNKLILYFLLLIAAFSSCTERIDIELDDTYARLVVDGAISTDTMEHVVRLSKTSSYYYNQPAPAITGANVSITDGHVTYHLTETKPGIYKTEATVFGIAGNTYTLNIKLAEAVGNHTEYSANSTIYPIAPLDSINLQFHEDWANEGIWEIKCYVLEPPTVDFYRFLVLKNKTMVTDKLDEWLVSDDKFYNGNYTNGLPVGYLDQADGDEAVAPGDTVGVELNNIGKDYFTFISTAQLELFGSNPMFGGPPANIAGNINNGGFGYFAAYSVARAKAIVPEFKK